MADDCKQARFRLRPGQAFGYATCAICGHEDFLYVFLNAMIERLETLEMSLNAR